MSERGDVAGLVGALRARADERYAQWFPDEIRELLTEAAAEIDRLDRQLRRVARMGMDPPPSMSSPAGAIRHMAQQIYREDASHVGDMLDANILEDAADRLERYEAALHRIIGMCDVPPHCKCGRPNGLPAVVAVASRALRPEATP